MSPNTVRLTTAARILYSSRISLRIEYTEEIEKTVGAYVSIMF